MVRKRYVSKTKSGKCVFCEIAKGNLKTPGIFWENKNYMAFLSLYPNTKGATVLITKKHYSSDVLSLNMKTLTGLLSAAKRVSKILIKYFDDVGRVGVIAEGTGIDHAHLKLIPMHGTGHFKKGEWKQHLSNFNRYFEKYEGFLSSNDGPKANPKELKKLTNKLKMLTGRDEK